jgi:hypothetical protein
MRRLVVAGVVALLAGCGGSTGSTAKHPDASGDTSPAVDHPAEAAGEADAPAVETGAGDAASEAAAEVGGDVVGGEAGGDVPTAVEAGGEVSAVDAADAGAGDTMADAGADVEAPAPRRVTVAYTGQVVTVAPAPDGGMPLGFDTSVRTSAVSGSFSYDPGMADDLPNDPKNGKYQRGGVTAFSFTLQGHVVTGSGRSLLETQDMSSDTFRFRDGPQGDAVVRTMKLDGADRASLVLFLAISDSSGAMLTSDVLPDPFPTVNIANKDGGFNIAHTFSLADSGGTLLMQLDTLVSQ